MEVSLNNQPFNVVLPRYVNQEITIAIDSSKTNTGISIGDTNCNLIEWFDINGEKDGTTEQDVLILCQNQRKMLSTLLKGAKIKLVGIENIITKNETRYETKDGKTKKSYYSGGLEHHESRFKITAVFMSYIFFFQEEFGITPELVNNWSWKATVLPEEFRSKKYDKGSLAYFQSINSPYQYCTDDATDSMCILEYLRITHGLVKGIQITEPESPAFKYKTGIVSDKREFKNEVKFIYNKDLTYRQNVAYMVNRIKENEAGCAIVPTSDLDLEIIYTFCMGNFEKVSKYVKVIVRRE